MSLIRRLLEMIRFSHTIFAMPFALSAAILAWKVEPFRWVDLVGILLGMVSARSAAMAFNRIVDRKFDAENPRTAKRHLVVGSLSLQTVILFAIISSVIFIASTLLFYFRVPSNPWPLRLSVPVLLFICAYSFTKRFTFLCHLWLGASLMLAPIAAWIAIRGMTDLLTPGLLGVAVFFWVSGFDILYACQDVDFDREKKLASIPAKFGVGGALRIAMGLHFIMIAILALLYFVEPNLKEIYLGGLIVISMLVLYQHLLVSPDDLTRVNQAFFQVNAVISFGLFLIIGLQLLLI